jgi:spore cortex formation protein SpoVR/YcgB (stage V sporulation)
MELAAMLAETLAETMLERPSETVAEMSSEKAVEIVSGKATERLADVMEENGNPSVMYMKVHGMQSAEEREGQKEAMKGVQRGAQSEEVTGEAETCENLVAKSDVTTAEAEAEKMEVQAENGAAMKAWTREVMTRDREEDKFASRWWEA